MSFQIRKLAAAAVPLALIVALSGCSTYTTRFSRLHLSALDPFHTSENAPAAQNENATAQMPSEPEAPVAGKPVIPPDTPPLYCRIGRGSARFNNGWYDYRDTTFTLYDGVSSAVALTAAHSAREMTLQALYDKKGQKLLFCPTIDGAADGHIACASFYVLQADLYAGIKRTFDVPSAERDGEMTCAYSLDHLRTFKLPPE